MVSIAQECIGTLASSIGEEEEEVRSKREKVESLLGKMCRRSCTKLSALPGRIMSAPPSIQDDVIVLSGSDNNDNDTQVDEGWLLTVTLPPHCYAYCMYDHMNCVYKNCNLKTFVVELAVCTKSDLVQVIDSGTSSRCLIYQYMCLMLSHVLSVFEPHVQLAPPRGQSSAPATDQPLSRGLRLWRSRPSLPLLAHPMQSR